MEKKEDNPSQKNGKVDLMSLLTMFQNNPELFAQVQELNARKEQGDKIQAETNKKREQNEQRRKEKNLPIYSKRDEIMAQIKENKFTIVVGDTGCGKSTQLPQYLFEHYEGKAQAKILWVLPRKLPAITLAERVSEEMELTVGEEIGYEVPNKSKLSPKTFLQFVTDSILIKELVEKRQKVGPKGRIRLKYSIVVLDEVHERNLYTDILLATLKDIALNSDMKLLVTSATINEAIFEKYFETKSIHVKGRPFPVELQYQPLPENLNHFSLMAGTHIDHMYKIITNVLAKMDKEDYPYKGHILVFTSGLDDIHKLAMRFADQEEENQDWSQYEILPLHGLLSPQEQKAVFRNTGQIKIILSTRIAETALTIDGVRVVIDIGFDKETNYDSIKRMTIIENRPIPQSSATQRAGRAGRTSPGLCIRLYTEEQFQMLSRNKKPEIQRMDLGKAILKLKAMGVVDILKFDFVEKPDERALEQTLQHLKDLGALDRVDESLTDIGEAMLELETDPAYSKAILEGLKRGCAEEIIKIIGMIGVNNRLFRRGNEDESKELSDKKKLGVCHDQGDLLTLLNIYRTWENITNRDIQIKWCKEYRINPAALNEAQRTSRDLLKGLDQAKTKLKGVATQIKNGKEEKYTKQKFLPSKTKNLTEEERKEIELSIVKCFLTAFYQNVCLYTGIPKLGYTLLRDNMTLKLHGSSSMALLQDYPEYILCLDINKGNYNHTRVASHLQQEWFEELFPGYKTNPNFSFLLKSYKFVQKIFPKIGRQILRAFIDPTNPDIKGVSETVETSFFVDLKEEKLHVCTSLDNSNKLIEKVKNIFSDIQSQLESETREISMTLKTRCIFQSGGEVKDILLGNDSVSLTFDNFDPSYTEIQLLKAFQEAGEVSQIVFTEVDLSTGLRHGVIRMENQAEAAKALKYLTENNRLSKFKKSQSELEPVLTISPFSWRTSASRALRLNIDWFTGKSEERGMLIFRTPESAFDVLRKITNSNPKFGNNEIYSEESLVMHNIVDTGILSIYQHTSKKKLLILDYLGEDVDEIDLETMLKDNNLDHDLIRARIFRDSDLNPASPENLSDEINLAIIQEQLFGELGLDPSEILRIECKERGQGKNNNDHRNTDYRRRIMVDVFDLEVARKIIKYFDGNTEFSCLTEGKLHCRMTFTKKRLIRWFEYRTVKDELQKVFAKIKEEKGNTVRIIEDREPLSHEKNKRVGVRVVADDPLTLDYCCKMIDPILYGTPFFLKTLSQYKKSKLDITKRKIETIELDNSVSIKFEPKRSQYKVIGEAEKRNAAIKALEKYFNTEQTKESVSVKVSFRHRPVKHIFENDCKNLVEIEEKFDVKIEYSLVRKEIIIKGKFEKVNEAEKEVKNLVNKFEEKEDCGEEECPLCLDKITEGYRLHLCGHKYCFSCIELELEEKLNNDPEFPFYCSQCVKEAEETKDEDEDEDEEENKNTICLKDLSYILTPPSLQNLYVRSLEKYLAKHTDKYFQCFSPNCPQIFRVSDEKQFSCDYCLKSYCKKCKNDAHGADECEDEARIKLIEDLKKIVQDVRECKNCKCIIEKDEGCTKVQCPS